MPPNILFGGILLRGEKMDINAVKEQVRLLLDSDASGHGFDHVRRVEALALSFARKENADETLTSLIALLHDADDYKLFGEENEASLPNARRILTLAGAEEPTAGKVIAEIKRLGYSKALNGVRPLTPEGKCVSDADMCDALGANGILRTYAFGAKHDRPFYLPEIAPREELSAREYRAGETATGVGHMFEKILRLKNYMLTSSGKTEAETRHRATAAFLDELFREENDENLRKKLQSYT